MGALAHVARNLPRAADPNLLVGADHFDDAGVYKLDASTAIVLTVDFFPPLVDDPYEFGRIAAAGSNLRKLLRRLAAALIRWLELAIATLRPPSLPCLIA